MVSDAYLNRLAVKMFREFARMEYALKAAGYHKGNGDAKPDWIRFARSIKATFEHPVSPQLEKAVKFILGEPPKKQVVKDGQLEWDQRPPGNVAVADLVATYVCRVRNNLFHGGKFNGRWFAPERSAPLLRHSLTILKACLAASPELRQAYEN